MYKKHLGMQLEDWGCPSDSSFMINYRVDNLVELWEPMLWDDKNKGA